MGYLRFFSSLTETLTAIALGGGYLSLFLITFLEGLPLIGILIPGHVAVVAAGFLISVGVFQVKWVVVITIVGAVAGDYVSFALGHRYGWPLIERLRGWFFIKNDHLEKAKQLLATHTGKALIIGRFNPVTRGIMPFLVGASRSPSSRFWLWNIVGAVAWVLSSLLLGYGLGFGYHLAAGEVGKLALAAVLLGLLIIWAYRFVNARFHIFRRYELFVLGLNFVALLVLARMIQDAFAAQSFMAGFDTWVNIFMMCLSGLAPATLAATCFSFAKVPSLVPVAAWVSALGGVVMASIVTIILGIILAARAKWRSSSILLLSMGSVVVAIGWLKDFFARARPDNLLLPAHPAWLSWLFDQANLAADPSFPSGHAAMAAALSVVVAYLWSPKIRSWMARELFIVLCVLIPIVVGLSRVVLNVHWASDVIAGWSLGVFCATSAILLVRYIGALIEDRVL